MDQKELKNIQFKKEEYSDYTDSEQSETDETNMSDEENVTQDLLEEISNILKTVIKQNKELRYNGNKSDKIFHVNIAPTITIYDYLYRIQKYLNINNSTLIISLIYIDRICKEKGIKLTNNNIHRILFSSIFTAIKYNEDNLLKTSFYARIAGISEKELIKLENAFLKLIEFKLFVSDEIYQIYSSYLFCKNKLRNN